MEKVDYIHQTLPLQVRKRVRKSVVQSLLIAYGIGGTLKRLLALDAPKVHGRDDDGDEKDTIRNFVQAVNHTWNLIRDVETGNRYLRALGHLKNKKLMLPVRKLCGMLERYAHGCMKYIHDLYPVVFHRVTTRAHNLRKYNQWRQYRGLYWQH